MGKRFNVSITSQHYVFTLAEPPTLKSLVCLVLAIFSWQFEIGRGFNVYVQIIGQQYAHMTYTLSITKELEFKVAEIMPFLPCWIYAT